MLRFLLIASLILYVLYKFGFFRIVIHEARNPQQPLNKRAPNSNLNVDSMPRKDKKKGDFDGGEYIDYEEVK